MWWTYLASQPYLDCQTQVVCRCCTLTRRAWQRSPISNPHLTCETVTRYRRQYLPQGWHAEGLSISFSGLGNVGKPVSFVLDPHVVPVQAPIHRIPVTKRERVKLKLDEMVRDGKLAKVEEPTDWCSNMTVVERIKSNGSIKTRLCLDQVKRSTRQSWSQSSLCRLWTKFCRRWELTSTSASLS